MKFIKFLLAALSLVVLSRCQGTGNEIDEKRESTWQYGIEAAGVKDVEYEHLRDYTYSDLKKIEKDFFDDNSASLLGWMFNFTGDKARYDSVFQMRAYKVKLLSESPDGSGAMVNLSGALIVPPLKDGAKYRRVIAPPYTYIRRTEAPTLRISNGNLDPNLVFWLLESYSHGFALIVPDYPGFGDSFGQCFIPYVEKKPMVRTTLEFVGAAQAVLAKENYPQKEGYIISGYSLGAYVSLQLACALESGDDGTGNEFVSGKTYEYLVSDAGAAATYARAGYETVGSEVMTTEVDYLFAGGSPCDLLEEANLVRKAESLPQPYLMPLALLGYKKNGYPQLDLKDYLNEPYATLTEEYLNGAYDDYADKFPKKTSELFTEKFIKNEGMDEANGILAENSVEPWRNRCKFIMTHGRDDNTVYFEQAKNFAANHNASGGSVRFDATGGSHSSAGLIFFLTVYSELLKVDTD
ncbi:MAG: alpha/beta hydrolase [Tannerella sp.]|jgi:pimeloyl-ACP methyl ester carboxylesterase|nr:alpha/beta hydrolase [Tannerella sp.]